jgi:hypothetical protein
MRTAKNKDGQEICRVCGTVFKIGQAVLRVGDGMVHLDCYESAPATHDAPATTTGS